jgi:threonine synthase
LILTGHLLKDPEFTLKFHRGDLFAKAEAGMTARQQRAPIVLDASIDAVLATLEAADKAGPQG